MATAYWQRVLEDDGGCGADDGLDLKSKVLAYERRLIEAALAETRGNQRRAARLLGMLPTTLNEKMRRLGLRAGTEEKP